MLIYRLDKLLHFFFPFYGHRRAVCQVNSQRPVSCLGVLEGHNFRKVDLRVSRLKNSVVFHARWYPNGF